MRKARTSGATEQWLRTIGVARYDAYYRDANGRPATEVFARLRKHAADKRLIKTLSSTKR